jgi:hypothetical protein
MMMMEKKSIVIPDVGIGETFERERAWLANSRYMIKILCLYSVNEQGKERSIGKSIVKGDGLWP